MSVKYNNVFKRGVISLRINHVSIYSAGLRQSLLFYTLAITFGQRNSDTGKWKESGKCHIELAMGKKRAMVDIYIKGLSVCPWDLLIVITDPIFIGSHLLHGLQGVVGSDGYYWILGIRTGFQDPVISAAKCSCKTLAFMWCHHRWRRVAKICHIFPMISIRGNIINP